MSNNFAVSSTNIATALTKQSASLAAYGNDINQVIALTTAGTEILTNNASKVSRGIKTVGANIVKMAQSAKSFDIQVQGATKTIQLWNDEGTDILSTYDVLEQVAQYWNDMTDAEKSALAISQAGKNQLDVYTAVLSNFNTAIEARQTAIESENSAWRENEAYLESVEAKTNLLKAQYEELVLSLPIEELEKALLNAGTALLKFANSDMGSAIIKATLLAGAFGAIMVALQALLPVIIATTSAMLANPIFWGAAAVAGIVLLVSWLQTLNESFDEVAESFDEANQAVQDQTKILESATKEIENIEDRLKEIADLKLSITDEDELKTLEQEEKALKREEAIARSQLAIEQAKLQTLKDEAKARAEQLLNPSNPKYTTTSYNAYNVNAQNSPYEEGSKEVKNGGVETALTQQISNIKGLEERIDSLRVKLKALQDVENSDEQAKAELSNEIQELNELLVEEEKSAQANAEVLLDAVQAEYELTDAQQEALDAYTDYYNTQEEVHEQNQVTEQDINDLVARWSEAEDAVEQYNDALEGVTSPLSEAEDAFGTLENAVKEFNTSGGFTAKTIQELSALSEDWTQLLTVQNGQLVINQENLKKLEESTKQEAIANLQAQAAQDMMNIATGNFSAISPIAQQALTDLADKTKEEAEQATNAAGKELLLASAIEARKAAEAGTSYEDYTARLKMIEAVKNGYGEIIDSMSKWTLATDASTSSAGSHKDAWVEAFEEEKDALKNLLETDQITQYEYYQRLAELNEKYFGEISGNHEKYIKEYRENEEEIYKGMKEVYDKVRDYLKEAVEQGYEKAINSLKKEEKAVLAEIKKQIEAIKKEKEEVIKGIEKQIKALKKEKEAVEKYYNDQIDAIKRENEALQQQNELLEKQQELQKAKQQKVMVMQNGRFQLTENESAVSQAEQNLSNYEDQLSYEQQIQQLEDLRDAQVETIEERIEALEEYKEYMEEYYDEQIEAMEEYYDQVQEQYELQIEALQEELDTFKEGYQKEEDLENARLAAQVLGMNERKDLYSQELENLKNYINEVNRMLESLGEAGVQVDFSYSPITGYHEGIAEVAGVDMALETRASGDASFGKDSVALVGESPNAELLLGSKVNTIGGGKLMHLQKGTGVVNAESTQTLAGLLNGLATPQTNVANNRSTQQNFSFGTISLPNVTDADSFVNTLSHKFNNYAIQYGNTRK